MQMIVGQTVEDHAERAMRLVSGISDRARREAERRMVGATRPPPPREPEPSERLRDAA